MPSNLSEKPEEAAAAGLAPPGTIGNRSLALLHLAGGRSGDAAAEYRRAAELHPREYEATLTGDRLAAEIAQPRFRFLRDNPTFERSVPAFLAALARPAPAP